MQPATTTATEATTTDPGPFGIDTPDYSDRDREMFVLGYEFAQAKREFHRVKARDIPAFRLRRASRTVHAANVPRLTDLADKLDLDLVVTRLKDGWCRVSVEKNFP